MKLKIQEKNMRKLLGILMGLTMTASAFADMGNHLLGTWAGTNPIITSKLISAAHGNFNKALVNVNQTITVTAAQNGLCIATLGVKAPSKILFDLHGHMVDHRFMLNMPCLYEGHHLEIATNNGATRDCKVNGNSMTCWVINSRATHQTAAILYLTKEAKNS